MPRIGAGAVRVTEAHRTRPPPKLHSDEPAADQSIDGSEEGREAGRADGVRSVIESVRVDVRECFGLTTSLGELTEVIAPVMNECVTLGDAELLG